MFESSLARSSSLCERWGVVATSLPGEAQGNNLRTRSTIVTSQLPSTQYHDYIGEPTLADSICDRLLHNSHRIVLKGPSRRKEDKLDT